MLARCLVWDFETSSLSSRRSSKKPTHSGARSDPEKAQEDLNDGPEVHDEAENDGPLAQPVEDGSNVVSVDFKRKK